MMMMQDMINAGDAGEVKHPVDSLVMLSPYISPEHAEIIDRATSQLKEYETMLIARLQNEYPAAVSAERVDSMQTIQRLFLEDPIRRDLIKSIATLRLCFEKPRFTVKA